MRKPIILTSIFTCSFLLISHAPVDATGGDGKGKGPADVLEPIASQPRTPLDDHSVASELRASPQDRSRPDAIITEDDLIRLINEILENAAALPEAPSEETVLQACSPLFGIPEVNINLVNLVPPKTWREVFMGMPEDRQRTFKQLYKSVAAQQALNRLDEDKPLVNSGVGSEVLEESLRRHANMHKMDIQQELLNTRRSILQEYVKFKYRQILDGKKQEDSAAAAATPPTSPQLADRKWVSWLLSWVRSDTQTEGSAAQDGAPLPEAAATAATTAEAHPRDTIQADFSHSPAKYRTIINQHLAEGQEIGEWQPETQLWFLMYGTDHVFSKESFTEFKLELPREDGTTSVRMRQVKQARYTLTEVLNMFLPQITSARDTETYVGYWDMTVWAALEKLMTTPREQWPNDEQGEPIEPPVSHKFFDQARGERDTYMKVSKLVRSKTPIHTWDLAYIAWLKENPDKTLCMHLEGEVPSQEEIIALLKEHESCLQVVTNIRNNVPTYEWDAGSWLWFVKYAKGMTLGERDIDDNIFEDLCMQRRSRRVANATSTPALQPSEE